MFIPQGVLRKKQTENTQSVSRGSTQSVAQGSAYFISHKLGLGILHRSTYFAHGVAPVVNGLIGNYFGLHYAGVNRVLGQKWGRPKARLEPHDSVLKDNKAYLSEFKMKIGLALGSGSSRGWSHIGVIKALTDRGIVPDIVCGTSIGALVGASYVSNNLGNLEQWVVSLTRFDTARFLEINRSLNGFVNTERLHHFLTEYVARDGAEIEQLAKQFAAIATDLETGREVWLMKGSVLEAVWSSISLPGLFPAIQNNNKWLLDGGLVNPVPVSVCRALGADVVIAVNLNGDIVGKHFQKPKNIIKRDTGVVAKFTDLVTEYTASVFPEKVGDEPPSMFEAIAASINITQDRITRSRMAGDPPDILLAPKLANIGLLEFYRAKEAISEGEKCVQRMLPEIHHVLGMA